MAASDERVGLVSYNIILRRTEPAPHLPLFAALAFATTLLNAIEDQPAQVVEFRATLKEVRDLIVSGWEHNAAQAALRALQSGEPQNKSSFVRLGAPPQRGCRQRRFFVSKHRRAVRDFGPFQGLGVGWA